MLEHELVDGYEFLARAAGAHFRLAWRAFVERVGRGSACPAPAVPNTDIATRQQAGTTAARCRLPRGRCPRRDTPGIDRVEQPCDVEAERPRLRSRFATGRARNPDNVGPVKSPAGALHPNETPPTDRFLSVDRLASRREPRPVRVLRAETVNRRRRTVRRRELVEEQADELSVPRDGFGGRRDECNHDRTADAYSLGLSRVPSTRRGPAIVNGGASTIIHLSSETGPGSASENVTQPGA